MDYFTLTCVFLAGGALGFFLAEKIYMAGFKAFLLDNGIVHHDNKNDPSAVYVKIELVDNLLCAYEAESHKFIAQAATSKLLVEEFKRVINSNRVIVVEGSELVEDQLKPEHTAR